MPQPGALPTNCQIQIQIQIQILALLHINQEMLTCNTVRTKDSCLIIRFQTLWPRRVTMLWHLCTLSKPHQIQWVWIHFCCSSNSLLLGTDVLKYELCVYPPALFEPAGTMLQSDKPSQANATQGWIHPSSIQIPQYVSYIYVGGALIKKKSMENWADLWVTVWKVYWVCKKNRTNESSFCLMATQVVLLQKTILIWDGRNHLAVTLLIWKRQPRYTA